MATTNMKRIAGDILANFISTSVPGLAGKVSVAVAGPEVNLPCLALRIIPDKFTFEPAYDLEVYTVEPDDGKMIVDVGQWVGSFTMELYTTSPAERELYEQAITDLFISSEWSPGTIFLPTPTLTVMGYTTIYQDEVRYALQDEDWMDELAFESKRYCFMSLDVDYPALVAKDAHDLDIRLMFSDDFEAVITDVSQTYKHDRVDVQADGSTILADTSTPEPA